MSTERIAEAEHQIVLLLEIEELVANIKKEAFRDADFEIGELIGRSCFFRTDDIIPYS